MLRIISLQVSFRRPSQAYADYRRLLVVHLSVLKVYSRVHTTGIYLHEYNQYVSSKDCKIRRVTYELIMIYVSVGSTNIN